MNILIKLTLLSVVLVSFLLTLNIFHTMFNFEHISHLVSIVSFEQVNDKWDIQFQQMKQRKLLFIIGSNITWIYERRRTNGNTCSTK